MSDIIPYDPRSLTRRGNDKSLFPLPSLSDDGSRLCVRVNIPNIPAHRQAFIGAIYNLTRWYSWGQDEAHTALTIAHVWRDVFAEMMANFYDNCADCPPEDRCRDFPTDSGVLTYFPGNPFTEPEYIPNQFYNKPPFYLFHGDVLTDITCISANPLDLPFLAATELPRIRVTVNGDKLVRLHLLSIIQGGYASIIVDDNPLAVNWVDLTRASLLDFQALLIAIEEGLGIGSLTGVLVEDVIVEIKLETVEEHHIDIVFFPKFNTEVIFGFGGGLRKVEICGNDLCEDDMSFELRQNPDDNCLIEQRLTADSEWIPAFNLGACMTDNCCETIILIFRITIDGTVESSDDGGITWDPAPQYDPRNNSPQFPPIMGDDGDDKKCVAATGMADLIKEQVGDNLTDDMSRYTLSQLITDWINTMLATSNIFQALLTVITNQIFALSIAIVRPALTTDVYDDLKCIFYCNMGDDASFNASQWAQVRSDITSKITGIAGVFLEHLIFLLGVVGLSNLARSAGATTGDCSDCECSACGVTAYVPPDGGTLIGRPSECVIDVEMIAESGHYAFYLWMGNDTDTYNADLCGMVTNIEVLSGDYGGFPGYNECHTGTLHYPVANLDGVCGSQFYFRNATPCTLRITYTAC